MSEVPEEVQDGKTLVNSQNEMPCIKKVMNN